MTGGLAAEGGGGDLREQRRRLLAVGGGGALEQVQRGGRGASVSLAQPSSERRAVLAHAAATELSGASEPSAGALAPEPLPAPLGWGPAALPTSATISRMMREMSKSFGV